MSTSPLIRSLAAADLERVLEINETNVPEVGPLDGEQLAFLVDESAIALCAEHDGEIVGFCLVLAAGSTYGSVNYAWCMEHYPDALYLDRVAFVEQSRGKGWGTQMYAEVDRRIRHDHPEATALTLEVNIDPPNEPSLRFHSRRGFSEVGRQMSHGHQVSLMRRPIT